MAIAFPGGGYSRRYWDIQWRYGYSQAAYHVSRGWVGATVDHLRVAESSLPDTALLSFEVMARANAAASRHIVTTLSSGDLADSRSVDVFSWSFHFDDVDPGIRDEDLSGEFPFRTESVPPWGSATALDVPVFIGVGERDVCPDPRAEPASYRGTDYVTVCVVDRMAHMHNFASSRSMLWNRLHRRAESLSR